MRSLTHIMSPYTVSLSSRLPSLFQLTEMDAPNPTVPELSSLQFLALAVLQNEPASGAELRDHLRGFGVRRTRAAFYQFMSRLERDGLVEGSYGSVKVAGRTVTERRYEITPAGRRAWAATRAFNRAVEAVAAGGAAGA